MFKSWPRNWFAVFALAALSLPAFAQQAATSPAPRRQPDEGVAPNVLMNRDEVRVLRVEIQPGATRRTHTHDDVQFHLWVPVSGTLKFTMGSDAPVDAAVGQAFFMKRGTPHSFTNTGSTVAVVMEVFIKDNPAHAASIKVEPAGGAERDTMAKLALALAQLGSKPTSQ